MRFQTVPVFLFLAVTLVSAAPGGVASARITVPADPQGGGGRRGRLGTVSLLAARSTAHHDINPQRASREFPVTRPCRLSFDQGATLGDRQEEQESCTSTTVEAYEVQVLAASPPAPPRTRYGSVVDLLRDLLLEAPRRAGPELAMTSVCSVVYLLWQSPALQGLMQRHFLSSAWNVQHGRPHACLLSAVSHHDFLHLFSNLIGLFAASPTVRPLLGKQYPWVFLSSVLVSDLFQTLRNPDGSSMGLSGFLMTLLALLAEYYPDSTLHVCICGGGIPFKAKARHVLYCTLAHTVVMVLRPSNDGIGHAAHLGGLLYGVLYARWPRKQPSRR
jgi:membrane associated rhomboid family serine protease